jgi:glucose/mannose-6-phosphate isomerase
MEKLIELFTKNIEDAINFNKNHRFLNPKKQIDHVLICGMGGSGIGGKMVSQWVESEIKVPIRLCQDYDIPAFVNENTLVIASSYSGNTEETLSAVKLAHAKGAVIVGITSGGELQDFCKKHKYDFILVPGGNQPRAAIGYSITQLIYVLKSFDLISAQPISQLVNGKNKLIQNLDKNKQEGKKLASFLYGKTGIIYSETKYESVAVRARQQLNENSKYLAWSMTIPEMNHNELVGWGGGSDHFAVIFIKTDDVNPRNNIRIEKTKEIISKKTPFIYELKGEGNSYIERSLHLISVMDWASFYLCELNKADIFDIKVIDYLKSTLEKV